MKSQDPSFNGLKDTVTLKKTVMHRRMDGWTDGSKHYVPPTFWA